MQTYYLDRRISVRLKAPPALAEPLAHALSSPRGSLKLRTMSAAHHTPRDGGMDIDGHVRSDAACNAKGARFALCSSYQADVESDAPADPPPPFTRMRESLPLPSSLPPI